MKLTADQINMQLHGLPDWSVEGDALVRTFEFADFMSAIDFMNRCAHEAEKLAHHPDWRNVYNRVEVTLTTHDKGGITERDFLLARFMDAACT